MSKLMPNNGYHEWVLAMTERIRYERPKERSEQYDYEAKDAVRDQEEGRRAQATREAGKAAVKMADDILADIDEALEGVTGEQTVEQWVNSYQMKGGE